MTEYETLAPEVSENITLIGNQQETKGETRLMTTIEHGSRTFESNYDTCSYTAQSYYKSTINNYLRENWNGDIERYGYKNRVIYQNKDEQ